MKLSCKVVEDMLPIYCDGVCSEESAALVEEHLKACPRCRRVLSDLRSEIGIPKKAVDDLKPLRGIQKKWEKSKRRYIGKGVFVTLAAFLLSAAVLAGIWYFSYAKYWYRLTEVMDRAPKDDVLISSSDYVLERDGYRFDVCLPIVLSDSGFVRVMNGDGLVLFLYPQTGGSCSFWLYITGQDRQAYSVYLKADMTPDFENHPFPVRSEREKAHITQLLTERQADVSAMLDAIQSLWGIELLKYAPQ